MSFINVGFAWGGSIEQNNNVVVGVDPKTVDDLIKRHGDYSELQKREIARLESLLKMSQGQVRAALEIMGEADIAPEEYGAKLLEIAQRLNALYASTQVGPSDNAKIAGLKIAVQQAIEAGELASADDLFSQIETEQEQSLRRQGIDYAKTLEQRGDLAFARFRYREAAHHYARAAAAASEPCAYSPSLMGSLGKEVRALYIQGIRFGDTEALLMAEERCRALSRRIPRTELGGLWATTQNMLVDILTALERGTGTERLQEAAAVLEEVLTEVPRERYAIGWASAQKNLGHVLLRIGEREPGTRRFQQAVDAYRAALEVFTRARDSKAWALAKIGLGAALARVGERENDVVRLKEAFLAIGEALDVLPRRQFPLEWAEAQTNLSHVLLRLGERAEGTFLLAQSVAAAHAALEEGTRTRTPLGWAETQVNLGNALAKTGERERDMNRLEEAVLAYRAASEELTCSQAPLYHAIIQKNLRNVFSLIGELDQEARSANGSV